MISATIITLNEEDKIANAIKSVESLAEEIIIVDCGSIDRTLEIARNLGAKVYYRKFDNFANQKNYAVLKTEGDWIIALDADEEITSELVEEIKSAVQNNKFNGFLIPRRNFILGSEIKHSRWSPDRHIWLWKKGFGEWVGDVHEEVVVTGDVEELKNCKIHNSHKTINDFIKANNLYSTLEAKKINFSFWRLFWDPLFEFFIRFIYKRGFLDGKTGFILAYLMSIYKLTVFVKAWENR